MRLPYKVDYASLEFKNGVFEDKFGAKIFVVQKMGPSSNPKAYPYGFHQGVDTSASVNEFIHVAPEDCVVLKAVKNQTDSRTGFGNYVDLKGKETGWIHRLGHHKEVFVSEGQELKKGDEIGTEWRSGYQVPRDSGWHLHHDATKEERRLSSAETTKAKYIGQFQDTLKKILEDLPKEKEEAMYKEKFERLQHLFAELSVTASPHLTQSAIAEGLISKEKVDSFLGSVVHKGIVAEIFRKLLHREPDAEGLKFWLQFIVIDVFRGVGESEEFKKIISILPSNPKYEEIKKSL
jgi:murein DD-endopeptidase MepM/ murein hydrolase activator NlpD